MKKFYFHYIVLTMFQAKDAFRRGQVKRGKCHIWTGGVLNVVAILLATIFVTVLIALEISREKLEI